jgi:hypothetical protein
MTGTLVLVKFNDDGEITKLLTVAKAGIDGVKNTIKKIDEADRTYKAAAEGEAAKMYLMYTDATVSYDDKNGYLEGFASAPTTINVDESVVVISLLADDKNTTTTDDDEYSAEFNTGLAALEDINDEEVLVIVDSDDTFKFAKYVVTFNNDSDRENDLVGIVEEAANNKVGEFTLTVDGTTYTFKASDNAAYNTEAKVKALKDQVVLFSVETDKDGEEYAIIEGVLNISEMSTSMMRVTDTADGAVVFDKVAVETFNDNWHNSNDDNLFIRVTITDTAAVVVEDDEATTDVDESLASKAREVEFVSVEAPVDGEEIDAKFFAEDDGLVLHTGIVWVIEGLDWPEA